MWKDEKIRLVGLGVDNLTHEPTYQVSLFDAEDERESSQLEETIDQIKSKFGYKAITTASMNVKKKISKKY